VGRVVALLLVLCLTTTASAQPVDEELPYEPALALSLTGAGIAAYLLTDEVFLSDLAPSSCRWCEPPGPDRWLRDRLVWDDPATAGSASDVTGFVAVPLVVIGAIGFEAAQGRRLRGLAIDGAVVLEAVTIATDLCQLVKLTVGRERPFVDALDGEVKPVTNENNLSFYSGHATWSFAFATAAGTIASRRGYRGAVVVWVAGLGLAATTAYLRTAADKHWTSDVVIGAATGAAIGYAVPRYLHAPRRPPITVTPAPGGLAISGQF